MSERTDVTDQRCPRSKIPSTDTEAPLKGYKAYDENLCCQGFQYEIGATYEIGAGQHPVRCGSAGFHWCENPLDLWLYYDLTTSRFTQIEANGEHSRDDSDTKIASSKIRIGIEISLSEIIQRGVAWMVDFYQWTKKNNDSNLAASRNYSSLAASGNYSSLAASGNGSCLAASGNGSCLAASGYGSRLAASGYGSRLAALGYESRVNLGKNGCAVLAWHDGTRPRFTVIYEGENGIEAGVWYGLDGAGNAIATE